MEEESGWKLIHGDVFRFPDNINLFTACIGAGAHVREEAGRQGGSRDGCHARVQCRGSKHMG